MSKPSSLKPRRAPRTATKTDGKAKTRRKPKEVTDGKLVPSDRKPELRLDLFHIPVSRVKSEASYLVLMKGQKEWQMAKLEGRAWWVGDNLLGRLCDSALIVPTPNRVLHAIDDLADRFSSPLDDYGCVGSKQYYIDRDVIDYGNWLICHPGCDELGTEQQLAIFRYLRLEAAALLENPLGLDEIVVNYCVLDKDGNRVFEHVEVDECWYYARDRKSDWLDRLGAVFADGSVKLGHELAQRPWLEVPRRNRKPRR